MDNNNQNGNELHGENGFHFEKVGNDFNVVTTRGGVTYTRGLEVFKSSDLQRIAELRNEVVSDIRKQKEGSF